MMHNKESHDMAQICGYIYIPGQGVSENFVLEIMETSQTELSNGEKKPLHFVIVFYPHFKDIA